jgi:hypothetical protein
MKNLTTLYADRLNQIRRAAYTALGRGQYIRALKLLGMHALTAAQYRRMERAVEAAEYYISK